MSRLPRDHELERALTDTAARAAGFTNDLGLRRFADHRADPYGGVRADLDSDHETREELADASNYLLWGLVPLHARYLQGDPEATRLYSRRLRALSHVVAAWHDLHDHR